MSHNTYVIFVSKKIQYYDYIIVLMNADELMSKNIIYLMTYLTDFKDDNLKNFNYKAKIFSYKIFLNLILYNIREIYHFPISSFVILLFNCFFNRY